MNKRKFLTSSMVGLASIPLLLSRTAGSIEAPVSSDKIEYDMVCSIAHNRYECSIASKSMAQNPMSYLGNENSYKHGGLGWHIKRYYKDGDFWTHLMVNCYTDSFREILHSSSSHHPISTLVVILGCIPNRDNVIVNVEHQLNLDTISKKVEPLQDVIDFYTKAVSWSFPAYHRYLSTI